MGIDRQLQLKTARPNLPYILYANIIYLEHHYFQILLVGHFVQILHYHELILGAWQQY